jgi:type II pantothenate kinase
MGGNNLDYMKAGGMGADIGSASGGRMAGRIVLGIDIGGSTTKIVAFRGGELIGELQVKASDQLTSAYGAIGHLTGILGVKLRDVSEIVITGVGASFFDGDIYGIPTRKIQEFAAIGHGGLYLSGFSRAFVASLGTGSAIVRASKDGISHIGGSGVGGGTLLGLSSIILDKPDMDSLLRAAEGGKLENVDLTVGEITKHDIPLLPPSATAANFGKIKSTATDADKAVGLFNMVYQTIGMMCVFAARNDSIKDFVLTGSLATPHFAKAMLYPVGDIYGLRFAIPDKAAFATAIGAAVPFL